MSERNMSERRKNNMPIEFEDRRKEDRRKKNILIEKERRS